MEKLLTQDVILVSSESLVKQKMIGVKNIWKKHVPIWHSPSQSSLWFVTTAIVTPGVSTPITLSIFPVQIWEEEQE